MKKAHFPFCAKHMAIVLFACGVVIAALNLPPARRAYAGTAPPPEAPNMLAYIQGGDVWMKELPDSSPQRLTTDGRNRSPRWSASGEWIAFLKGDELWVVRKSGTDAKLLHGGGLGPYENPFQWSPTSDLIAFTTATGDLDVASPGATNARTIFANPDVEKKLGAMTLAWSPNGQWLAYGREQVLNQKMPPDLYAGLWRVRRDGTGAVQVFGGPLVFGVATPPPNSNPYGGALVASWSRDGQEIQYWQDPISGSLLADGTSFHSVAATGGTPTTLIDSMLAYSDFFSLSPDGKILGVTEGGGRETWSNKHIILLDLSSGGRTRVTGAAVAAFSPSWSPDGQRIAYAAAPDIGFVGGGNEAKAGAAKRRIWVMNRDGANQRKLTNDPAYRDERPLWAGDGRYLIFVRLDNATDKTSLWLVPSEGGAPQRVVDEIGALPTESTWFGYYGHIDWSDYFDLWTPPGPTQLPDTGSALPEFSVSNLELIVVGVLALLIGLVMITLEKSSGSK